MTADLITEARKYCWRPIAEAPKDGTHILAIGEYGQEESIIAWKHNGQYNEPAWFCMADGFVVIECEGDTFINYKQFTPTHFRHLDTPQNDITAKLIEELKDVNALQKANEQSLSAARNVFLKQNAKIEKLKKALEEAVEGLKYMSVDDVHARETLARIKAIMEGTE